MNRLIQPLAVLRDSQQRFKRKFSLQNPYIVQ